MALRMMDDKELLTLAAVSRDDMAGCSVAGLVALYKKLSAPPAWEGTRLRIKTYLTKRYYERLANNRPDAEHFNPKQLEE